jgi:hypothetical protein
MGFRDYDPGLNQFLTRDSYNGALDDQNLATDPFTDNRYAFTGGNPITNVELDGHCDGSADSRDCAGSQNQAGPRLAKAPEVRRRVDHSAQGRTVSGCPEPTCDDDPQDDRLGRADKIATSEHPPSSPRLRRFRCRVVSPRAGAYHDIRAPTERPRSPMTT